MRNLLIAGWAWIIIDGTIGAALFRYGWNTPGDLGWLAQAGGVLFLLMAVGCALQLRRKIQQYRLARRYIAGLAIQALRNAAGENQREP